jgi:hypothetical protein
VSALDRLPFDKQQVVRAQVRALLERSQAFAALPLEEKRKLARGLVDTVAFMADPAAGHDGTVGEALAGGNGAAKVADRIARKPDLVQKEFKAAATRQGGEIFEQAANAVDFPKFVAGLIDGVFNSIVTASIRQMEAYGKLLEQVVKSVDDFAKDNFTLNQGRDWLVDRFPASLRIDSGSGGPRLAATDAGEEAGLADVRQGLGVSGPLDLDDEAAETRLAQMAQLEMARLRQKQLATMVLMGINRIVVTDGEINAKVIIDVQANDRAQRKATAAMHDTQQSSRTSGSGGGWFSSGFDESQELHKTVVTASSSDESESKAELKAKLTGAVRVNFKSETVSLDKLASQVQIESLNERAQAPSAPAAAGK